MGEGMGTYRKFGGKVYKLFDWCASKEEADAELRELRDEGWLARRIIPSSGEGYMIYRRQPDRGAI